MSRSGVRAVVRWLIAVFGILAILAGAAVVGGAAWVRSVLDPQGSLSSVAQSISAMQCETLLIEVADVGVRAPELENLPLVAERASPSLVVEVVAAENDEVSTTLVGVADSAQVEERLLGSRYCIAESGPQGWSTRNITLSADAPDVNLDGLAGVWARSASGESVVIPIPEPGRTLVVSVDGPGEIGEVALVGRYRIEGAPDLVQTAFITGAVVIVVGLMLVIVAIVGFRKRGRHEGSVPTGSEEASSP